MLLLLKGVKCKMLSAISFASQLLDIFQSQSLNNSALSVSTRKFSTMWCYLTVLPWSDL